MAEKSGSGMMMYIVVGVVLLAAAGYVFREDLGLSGGEAMDAPAPATETAPAPSGTTTPAPSTN